MQHIIITHITTAHWTAPHQCRALTAMETLVAWDRKALLANHDRLAELYAHHDHDLMIVCAHDPMLFEQARATAWVAL
ncbi:MAG: hypothetical protein NVS4B6_16700 [Mycobacterium sp.]